MRVAGQDEEAEAIPRNRTFLLTRLVEATGSASGGRSFTEFLVDVTGDIRGQRIILLQKQKNADGTACKTNCMVARRLVNKHPWSTAGQRHHRRLQVGQPARIRLPAAKSEAGGNLLSRGVLHVCHPGRCAAAIRVPQEGDSAQTPFPCPSR